MKKLSILLEQEDLFAIDQRHYLKYKSLAEYYSFNKDFFKPFGIYEYNVISGYSWTGFEHGLLIPFGLDLLYDKNENLKYKYLYFLNSPYNIYEEEYIKDIDKILKNKYWSFNSDYMNYPGNATIFSSCNFLYIKDLDFSIKNFDSYFIRFKK